MQIIPVSCDPEPVKPFVYALEKPREVFIQQTGERVHFRKIKVSFESSLSFHDKNPARVDFDKLTWPLLIRNKSPGDRFRPLGMKGSKKVSRYFMDRKIPKAIRDRIPLVLSGGKIVWIAGMDIGQDFSLDSHSTKALEMEYLK
jgi:tRNA(Ile)-lysidine synthase